MLSKLLKNNGKDNYAELRKIAIEATDRLAQLPNDAPDRADVLSSAKRAQRKLFQTMLDDKIDGFVDQWVELSALIKLTADWGTLVILQAQLESMAMKK